MNHILIITGGHLNIDFAKDYIKTLSYDKVFVADKGLEYADELGIVPDYIVGDFDTVNESVLRRYEQKMERGELSALIERYPVKKDATDTEFAVLKAIEEHAEKITIIAATGNRLDHLLMNLGLLLQIECKGIEGYIVDEANRIQMLTSKGRKCCSIKKKEQYGCYLSVIPMTASVENVTLEGVMYPLKDRSIYQGESLTVSNQILSDEAFISISQGTVLLIESKDMKENNV